MDLNDLRWFCLILLDLSAQREYPKSYFPNQFVDLLTLKSSKEWGIFGRLPSQWVPASGSSSVLSVTCLKLWVPKASNLMIPIKKNIITNSCLDHPTCIRKVSSCWLKTAVRLSFQAGSKSKSKPSGTGPSFTSSAGRTRPDTPTMALQPMFNMGLEVWIRKIEKASITVWWLRAHTWANIGPWWWGMSWAGKCKCQLVCVRYMSPTKDQNPN